MTLDQIIRNVENTIRGKETYLSTLPKDSSINTVVHTFVQLNLTDLYRILVDLNKCKGNTNG
jgi:hypothetical protein